MKLQDALHGLLVVALVGVVVQPHLVGLVSEKAKSITEIVLVGLQAFVYYADVIFVKKQEVTVELPK